MFVIKCILFFILVILFLLVVKENYSEFKIYLRPDNYDFVEGRVTRIVVRKGLFVKHDFYEYTFLVGKKPFSGRYRTFHYDYRKQDILKPVQRIKFYTNNPKLNKLADVQDYSIYRVFAGISLGIIILFILYQVV